MLGRAKIIRTFVPAPGIMGMKVDVLRKATNEDKLKREYPLSDEGYVIQVLFCGTAVETVVHPNSISFI